MLNKELAHASRENSNVARRRGFKNIARKAEKILSDASDAPNRFALLAVVFKCQKGLLAMDNTERSRKELFETCAELVKAPDEYAEDRLDAELLLSDKELTEKKATLEERAKALEAIIVRYQDTQAAARSLLMAALIVQKLDAPELEHRILYTLDERFADDHEVIEFRRKHLKISRLDISFSGRHKRIDGAELVFPSDTMGHLSLMVFWSKDAPGIDAYLEKLKEDISRYTNLVDVFSFNVDQLPDGGKAFLHDKGLDWTIMKLPYGRKNQAYRTYAQGDPVALLVNEYGLTVTRPEIVHGLQSAVDPVRISEDRYIAQLQSLFIGEFLVTAEPSPRTTTQAPKDPNTQGALEGIQECFVPPPFRYRLTRAEALANYEKAEKLCTELIGNKGPADVWRVRDYKIVALLGMWNLACEPRYLEKAVKEAELTLKDDLSAEAGVVSRFCMAKAAMREKESDAESIVTSFLKDCGGDEASGQALAAAAMLALDARSRELHDKYRDRFLEKYTQDPRFYAFTSFLYDRHHRYRILKANHTLRERRGRTYIVGHGYPMPRNDFPSITLKKLDGSKLVLPEDNKGKLTYLLFIEPPDDPEADFPAVLDRRGKPTKNDGIRTIMGYAEKFTKDNINNSTTFITAFLTDNADHVKYLMKTNAWSCQAAMVPGGLKNPIVRQLGILSADRYPNVFVLRRDGTIAWHCSGLKYNNTFGFPFALILAMKVHVEVCEVEYACKALEKGDYKEAARIFTGPFLPAEPNRFGWRGPRYYGKTVALMGLKEWEPALESIECAIDAHMLSHYRGRKVRDKDWREDTAKAVMKDPCDIITMLWATKADILGKLGRKEESEESRKLSEQPAKEDYEDVYKVFNIRLNKIRQSKLR